MTADRRIDLDAWTPYTGMLTHRGLRATWSADGQVRVWHQYHRLAAGSVRTTAGQVIRIDAVVAPRWVDAGRARCVRDATIVAVGARLAIEMIEDARRDIEARDRDRRRGYERDDAGDKAIVRSIRERFSDPWCVVRALRLDDGARAQKRGVMIRCPFDGHAENTPSCSVTVGDDGTIRVRCFGCGESADLLRLIAIKHGLSLQTEFRAVLEIAAPHAGVTLPPRREKKRRVA